MIRWGCEGGCGWGVGVRRANWAGEAFERHVEVWMYGLQRVLRPLLHLGSAATPFLCLPPALPSACLPTGTHGPAAAPSTCSITWTEVKPVGPRPRGRCCTTLFPLEQRVLLFAGDTSGVNNELWSLRGLQQDGEQGLPAWTQLLLEGPQPPPRRGHAVAGEGVREVDGGGWAAAGGGPGRWLGGLGSLGLGSRSRCAPGPAAAAKLRCLALPQPTGVPDCMRRCPSCTAMLPALPCPPALLTCPAWPHPPRRHWALGGVCGRPERAEVDAGDEEQE